MFNSNKDKKSPTVKMSNTTSGNNLPSVNMISEGTHVKGILNTKNDIRIAGTLEGEAKANGKLIISSSGKVDGDVKAVDADLAGHLVGEIRVSNKLILRQSAVVDGDIFTKALLVEEGAQINGACHMGESSKGSSSSSNGSYASASSSKQQDKAKDKEKETVKETKAEAQKS